MQALLGTVLNIIMGSHESKDISGHGNSSSKTEIKKDREDDIVKAVAAVAVGVIVVWGIIKIFAGDSESRTDRKIMKAPGRNYYIYRDDFEDDPASYFRDLRK